MKTETGKKQFPSPLSVMPTLSQSGMGFIYIFLDIQSFKFFAIPRLSGEFPESKGKGVIS